MVMNRVILTEAKLHSRLRFAGMDISIEVPADGFRKGKNRQGEEWSIKIPAHYGYIKGTHSPDGEHLDCYVRKNPDKTAKVYVMHQLTVDGSRYDEDKVMLGYPNKKEAIKHFKEVTFKPDIMYGGCTELSLDHFMIAAYQASNSFAMITDEETYQDFKKRGLLNRGIKSPLQVARNVSESLSQGLATIAASLTTGELQECLEWGGLNEGIPLDSVLLRAYTIYENGDLSISANRWSFDEFKTNAMQHMMETDNQHDDTVIEVEEDNEPIEIAELDDLKPDNVEYATIDNLRILAGLTDTKPTDLPYIPSVQSTRNYLEGLWNEYGTHPRELTPGELAEALKYLNSGISKVTKQTLKERK